MDREGFVSLQAAIPDPRLGLSGQARAPSPGVFSRLAPPEPCHGPPPDEQLVARARLNRRSIASEIRAAENAVGV